MAEITSMKKDSESAIHPDSDSTNDYCAVRDGGAGLIDLSLRGRIRVSGSEAVQFLNGLITNDMKRLGEGHWMPAIFPNVQGRLLAAIRVAHDASQGGPASFLLDTESATHERVFKTIERFTFAGDFKVDDVTNSTVQFSVQGQKASALLQSLLGTDLADIAVDGVKTVHWNGVDILLIRSSHTGEDGFDLITMSDNAIVLREALLREGTVPVSADTFETLRIEAGIPRYGIDVDDTMVVSETGLDDAISFSKGCYVGQEIVARIKYRGHVAKKITGVTLHEDLAISPNAKVHSADDKEIGKITSVTYSPRLQQRIAIGVIKYQFLEAGTPVKVVVDDYQIDAEITDLPFIKSSDR